MQNPSKELRVAPSVLNYVLGGFALGTAVAVMALFAAQRVDTPSRIAVSREAARFMKVTHPSESISSTAPDNSSIASERSSATWIAATSCR